MKSDSREVLVAIELSRATRRTIHLCQSRVLLCNVVAFSIAAGVRYPRTPSPEIEALSMSGSSVLVALNAFWLTQTRLWPHRRRACASRVAPIAARDGAGAAARDQRSD